MTTSLRKKIFLVIFCLASITQGMYSTYFVSILTTIERVYQIQSKTAGAILSATEIGQIVGSLLIAYFGGRGNKPKWIAACMTLSAVAALISISPYFLLLATNSGHTNPQSEISTDNTGSPPISSASLTFDLNSNSTLTSVPSSRQSSRFEIPKLNELCAVDSLVSPTVFNLTLRDDVTGTVASTIGLDHGKQGASFGFVLVIFFVCLLAIGFGSTAITTLGIPFIDDIVSKEESPLYLGLTIGLKIFGPALGFLLGSFCINFNLNIINLNDLITNNNSTTSSPMGPQGVGAWWLGLIVISIPLLILALPMYFLSRLIDNQDNQSDDYADITYRAAEDHDIGGSHDFQSHMLGLGGIGGDLGDVTSDRTCFSSEIDSSSREVLQSHHSPMHHQYNNYGRNITMEPSVLTGVDNDVIRKAKQNNGVSLSDEAGGQPLEQQPSGTQLGSDTNNWSSNICVVVNHFGGLESSNFTNVKAGLQYDDQSQLPCLPSARSSIASSIPTSSSASSSSSTASSSSSKSIAQKPPKLQQATTPPQSLSSVADLAKTLSRLLKNKLLLLRMLSGILHILPIAGFYTFLPKYLIEQFRVTQSSASAVSGLAGILFVGLGAFLGGTIVRLLNVNSRLMTRWIAASALFYAIGMIVLMNLGCPQSQLVHYESREFTSTDCKSLCKCSKEIYTPVCANQTTYISPCLAGCRGYTISGDKIIFDECGCSLVKSVPNINSSNNLTTASTSDVMTQATTDSTSKQSLDDDHVNLNVATAGHCLIDCDNLKWYIVIFSISTLIHASCEVGSMMFNLRCVSSNDRTLALGLVTFSSSLLGSIPCSVIYGTIVDLTCVHWDFVGPLAAFGSGTDSTSRGACRAYENGDFRYYLHGVTASVMFLAFIVDCTICRRASEVDFYEDDNSYSRTDIRMELKKSTETI